MNRKTSDSATSQAIATRITEVTVYTSEALVTRRGTVALTGHESELIITGLPFTLQVDSVTVRGSGAVSVRLLGVRVERAFATEAFGKRLVQLERQIRQLEEQQRSVQDGLAILQLQRNFVQGLGENSVDSFSGMLAPERMNLSEIKEFLEFLGQQYSEYAQTIAQRERELQEIEKQLEIFRHQRQQMQQTTYKESLSNFNIIVAIEPAGAGDFQLEVSYLVNRAIWTPIYDVRTSSNSKRVHFTYQAEIRQKTGEDWTGVALTLSTAKPTLATLPPKLKPWYISSLETSVTRHGNCQEEDVFAELEALLADESDAPRKQDLIDDYQTGGAKVSKAGSVVTLRAEGESDIFSDAKSYKVTIFSKDYPGRTEYVAMPRLLSFAYLEATVKNRSNGIPLLPGKASVFYDNGLVGTAQLETVAPGETFKLNVGVEEGVKIERELVEREVELIGKYRRTTYGYRLVVTNLRDRKTTLKLIEQLPVSRNEQIKVHLKYTYPQIQLGEMGQLEWVLTLPRHSRRDRTQEVYYQFTVEHPNELTLVSLDL